MQRELQDRICIHINETGVLRICAFFVAVLEEGYGVVECRYNLSPPAGLRKEERESSI